MQKFWYFYELYKLRYNGLWINMDLVQIRMAEIAHVISRDERGEIL